MLSGEAIIMSLIMTVLANQETGKWRTTWRIASVICVLGSFVLMAQGK